MVVLVCYNRDRAGYCDVSNFGDEAIHLNPEWLYQRTLLPIVDKGTLQFIVASLTFVWDVRRYLM